MPIYMRPMNKSVILYLDTFVDQTFSQIVAWCPKRMAKNLHQRFFLGVCWRNQQVQLLEMKFIDVQCFLLFLNKYSLWQSSTSVWKCFAHIPLCVSIFTYICILCFFGICHGEAIHGCSEMVSSPLKDPCLHTWNNLKKHASSAVIGSVWEITLAPSPVVILMEGRVLLQPCHTLSKSRCVPSFAHQVLTPMDALYISKPFIANNKRPSKNTLQPVCLTPWRIGFCCHGSFCRRFHVDLGVPKVCMWSFPESCLAWHRWSRRLQLDIRGILVPFRWEASVFCCEESALLRERYNTLRLWERYFWCFDGWREFINLIRKELGSKEGNILVLFSCVHRWVDGVVPWNDCTRSWAKQIHLLKSQRAVLSRSPLTRYRKMSPNHWWLRWSGLSGFSSIGQRMVCLTCSGFVSVLVFGCWLCVTASIACVLVWP